MKIVDVCAFYAPKGGGVRAYVDRKLTVAAAAGHHVVVLAPGRADGVEQRGGGAIRWLRAPRFPLDANYRFFADRVALHAALDEERPDVVEVSSPWRSASLVADWRGSAPKVLIAHADPLSAFAYRWFGGVADRATIDRAFDWYWRHLRRLDARFGMIVCASPSLADRLRDGGLRRVVTNPMGVEAGRFGPHLHDAQVRADLLAACSLGTDATLLLAVGRHSPEKRWTTVIRAATLAGRDSPVGLVLIGDGGRRAAVMAAVAGNPHVRLIEPTGDRDLLARALASADGVIHGCEAETFCFVAAEAIASGTPLIAPDAGGAGDLARESGGLIYRSGDATDAARAIRALVERKDRRSAANGRPRTLDDHFFELFASYRAIRERRRSGTIATGAGW